MAAIVARRAAVVRPGQHGFAHRNHGNTERGPGPLHDFFRAAELERRQILAVGNNVHVLARAGDADHFLDVGIVGRDLLIADRPVFLDAFDAALAEIALGKTEAHGVPVNGAAADRADAVHADVVGTFVA